MKISEKSISIWTVVQLHKDSEFKNPSFVGHGNLTRISSIQGYDSWELRFWKEWFLKYKESIYKEEQNLVPDAQK